MRVDLHNKWVYVDTTHTHTHTHTHTYIYIYISMNVKNVPQNTISLAKHCYTYE